MIDRLFAVDHSTIAALVCLRVDGILSFHIGDDGLGHELKSINLFIRC